MRAGLPVLLATSVAISRACRNTTRSAATPRRYCSGKTRWPRLEWVKCMSVSLAIPNLIRARTPSREGAGKQPVGAGNRCKYSLRQCGKNSVALPELHGRGHECQLTGNLGADADRLLMAVSWRCPVAERTGRAITVTLHIGAGPHSSSGRMARPLRDPRHDHADPRALEGTHLRRDAAAARGGRASCRPKIPRRRAS